MKLAIVGAGWAGMSAAVSAVQAGHTVTVYEASRNVGGRARSLPCSLPDGSHTRIDNGQHILIGAYSETLALMRRVGMDPQTTLLRLPLSLSFPDGHGIRFPAWPAPFDALAGIVRAHGWRLSDKASFLRLALRWRLAGFECAAGASVADLCAGLSTRVLHDLVQPLCVSALNTPAHSASGQVFLRVMRDSLFGAPGSSNLLLPRVDLSSLFPDAAVRWVTQRGAEVQMASRVQHITPDGPRWRIHGARYDGVLLATTAGDAAHILTASLPSLPDPVAAQVAHWRAITGALQHRAITTVYTWGPGVRLAQPMLALRSSAAPDATAPAQFVFDRGQLGGPGGLLAFVISDSAGDRAALQTQVLAQAKQQLGCELQVVQTVVEKRATFACTPGLQRPPLRIAPALLACADYVQGPYPATLEGAVRAGAAAVTLVSSISGS